MAESAPQLRLRLKADGRVVEILPDGSERPVEQRSEPAVPPMAVTAAPARSRLASRLASLAPRTARPKTDADYARAIRAATKLTQAEFAARIGVPIETVRNWEQGKRSPRGPARALLKVIEQAPDLAFAALAPRART
ncbi:MAG TPA: helix-turn-helix domain-containing protein [Pseudorhodoplanes sp.]|nr:helix-turn-helix domain-containing protein [Pseudorhodoplanes sp.]